MYAKKLEAEVKAEQLRSSDLEARTNLLESTSTEINEEMEAVHRAFSKQRRKYHAMKQNETRSGPGLPGDFKYEVERQADLVASQGESIRKMQLRLEEQSYGQSTGTRTMFYGGKSLSSEADVYALLAGSDIPSSFAVIPSIYQLGSKMNRIMTGDQGDNVTPVCECVLKIGGYIYEIWIPQHCHLDRCK